MCRTSLPTDGIMKMTFGTKAFFGYLKRGRRAGALVQHLSRADESEVGPIADPSAYARQIASLHAGDPLDNARILAAVPSIERNYPVYDMDELSTWSTPRVLLMGDAAHAVAPHSGQGASMAIEDALVLAACLDEQREPRGGILPLRELAPRPCRDGHRHRPAGRIAKARAELAGPAHPRSHPAAGDADGGQGAGADVPLPRRSHAACPARSVRDVAATLVRAGYNRAF